MKTIRKKYKEPIIETMWAKGESMICSSVTIHSSEPEIEENDEDEPASPFWDVL